MATLEENADALGIPFSGGLHLFCLEHLVNDLQADQRVWVRAIVSGVIPPDDVAGCKSYESDVVFTAGTTRRTISRNLKARFN